MLPKIVEFLFQKDEPARSCLLAAREHILKYDKEIAEVFKFNMPFFRYKGEQFCYLSVYKKDGMPYIGFVEGKRFEHPALVQGERVRIKILPLDPKEELPVDVIDSVLEAALSLYK
jgi:hypothetical protein